MRYNVESLSSCHIPLLLAGHMSLEGLGQAKRLAEETAWEIAAGEPISEAVNLKAANLKQLSAIMAFACAKGGFPTINSHLYLDELAGLGWQDLQPMIADPWKGEEALMASIAALVRHLFRVQSLSNCSQE